MTAPLSPLEEQRAYRRALGCFATGVCLITVEDAHGLAAITVNSFTSVSLQPRLILWCLDVGSDRYPTFATAEAFGVNVLGASQQEVSARFARPGAWRIEDELVERWGHDGPPVLQTGLARLACRTHHRVMLGDHLVIVGEVIGYQADAGAGLTYFRGRYGEAMEPAA
jgi:flavin reductase (DIM6/NTAB) family NADH-FMN oxidoreductase RutF